jgi:pilus assembly protein Flp/PilA
VVSNVILIPSQEGQGLVEYALILVLVAMIVVAIMVFVGPALGNIFSDIASAM